MVKIGRKLLPSAFVLLIASSGFAQTGAGDFARQFLDDEHNLWTSPLRTRASDLKWLLPLSAGAVILLHNDTSMSREAEEADLQNSSHVVSSAGSIATFAAPMAVMAIGRLSGNEKASHAGGVALEAALHSTLIVQTLKVATNRQRPGVGKGQGDFWDGGRSFPSGHSMSAWAVASALADQYSGRKWVAISGYTAAAAVSLSRISGGNHFPSDVLVGSSLGWLVGHYISHRHK